MAVERLLENKELSPTKKAVILAPRTKGRVAATPNGVEIAF
jgi:hypothetical protein